MKTKYAAIQVTKKATMSFDRVHGEEPDTVYDILYFSDYPEVTVPEVDRARLFHSISDAEEYWGLFLKDPGVQIARVLVRRTLDWTTKDLPNSPHG
ncbi:MAG: hypothetical protein KOO63_09325 [Bacteroidales bacterium]|nr:hypothetical protein [Candidatus Latescibacterota bacterium]